MLTRIFVVAALVLASGTALASDVSYEKQIAQAKVTRVEGSLRGPTVQEKVSKVETARPSTGHAMACACTK
jgi:hypothetical protein